MKAPYGLELIEDCLSCPLLKDRVFCDLPKPALQGLDAISSMATYPRGAVLFVEGQEPRGVYILCNGRVKLSAGSVEGKSLILRIAEAGEIIGLPGTISNQPYELTAESLELTQTNFIRRDDFLLFLRQHGDAALRVAEMLSGIYYATCREVRYLGLSNSAAERLARFLLDLAGSSQSQNDQLRATLTLTHEEIAQMIGASRETVSRVFASFRRQNLIEVHGSVLKILDEPGLKRVLEA
jgi:CRP/FNR family transcriptional regulator, cyclic AMP receptor protein